MADSTRSPSWLRLVITAVISAVCCGGVVAAICVWWFHPGIPVTHSTGHGKVADVVFADDAGGAGVPLLSLL